MAELYSSMSKTALTVTNNQFQSCNHLSHTITPFQVITVCTIAFITPVTNTWR